MPKVRVGKDMPKKPRSAGDIVKSLSRKALIAKGKKKGK
jgi:hypothetical protein